jgi:hypothetical protein
MEGRMSQAEPGDCQKSPKFANKAKLESRPIQIHLIQIQRNSKSIFVTLVFLPVTSPRTA